jgi:hypothetical protein
MVLLLGYNDKKAVGTSLATILLPVGILGVIEHWRAGNIDLRVAALLGVGFVAGSFLGRAVCQSAVHRQEHVQVDVRRVPDVSSGQVPVRRVCRSTIGTVVPGV